MARQDLINYVKQYSAQGYSMDTLRNSLLQQGFPVQDVDEAITAVSGKKLPLIKIGFALGGIIVVVILALLLIGVEEEAPEIEKPAPLPSLAPLPEVEIQEPEMEEAVPEGVEEVTLDCPAPCNDYDICTRDICVTGACVFEEIQPCCGNTVCEFGETEDSCPEDCRRETLTQAESTDIILEKAEAAALSNPQQGRQLCKSLARTAVQDGCLKKIAGIAKDVSLCQDIYSMKKKDECTMNHAIEQEDFSVCSSISERWLRNSCVQYGRLRTAQAAYES